MQLKRLEAYGFKSFADKITIDFDQGITAIVGPNGSGKSNITDAIRWVLGEQNVRNLRGTKSEDIIFTGSASRRALGVAEVSLVMENDGTLPVDFREVVITRRLYRSGESEFFINRARCRLKDIYELFADTGIGHDGMSIIGQNRIDDILNARPEERRGFFEETAGITKYRNRKKESVRKLTDTENNLVRVQDILGEIEKQLDPLQEHAEKTRRWQALQSDYDQCRLTSLAQVYGQESAKLQENDAREKQAEDAAAEAAARVTNAEAKKAALAKDVTDIEAAMREQAAKNEALREQIERAGREMAALKERRTQSDARQKKLAEEKAQHEREAAEGRRDLLALEREQKQQEQDLLLASDLFKEEKTKFEKLSAELQQAVNDAAEQEKAAQELTRQLAEKKQELAVLDRDVEAGSCGQTEQEQALSLAEQAQKKQQEASVQAHAELETAEQAVLEAMTRQQKAERACRDGQEKLRESEKKRSANAQEIQNAKRQAEFLTRMQQSYEGFGKAARAVLRSKEPWRRGVAGAVAELIHVPQGYVTAIETALGGSLQDIVTQDTDTAKGAIAYLKQGRLGRVTFLPLSTLVVRRPQQTVHGEGVIGWASEIAASDPDYRIVVDFLLARTLVVDTLDHALVIAKANGYRLRIVTKGGELLNPGGSLQGGSSRRHEASFISRRGEIDALEEKLRTLVAEKETIEKEAAEMASRQKALEVERAQSLSALQQASEQRAALRVAVANHEERVKAGEAQLEQLRQDVESGRASFAEIQKKRLTVFRTVGSLEIHLRETTQDAREAAEKRDAIQKEADALTTHIHETELKHAVLEQTVRHSRERVSARISDIEKAEQALRDGHAEAELLQQTLETSEERMQELRDAHEKGQAAFDAGKAESNALYEKRMAKLAAGREAELEAKKAAQKQEEIREQKHSLELTATKLRLSLQDKAETLLHDFGLTPERAAEEALDIPEEEIKGRMRSLKRKIDELGPVNPNALQEYEELSQRHDFLQKQATDLVEARENLQQILDEMDAAMTKQFKAAFRDIQEYFRAIFVRLFGGGTAELRLLDPDNVLESGVDILVTLPEKKRQNLSALSGGERALTVIALLFAFLKYRPSPFAVLDEIDAPLDEANVVRFGRFLKEFSGHTQFIVVTHRKGTMEAVDTMYGVTIEDAGVSKILSVKLDEIKDER